MAVLNLKQNNKGKIILALSGGIDSGMSIKKLKSAGWSNIYAANHVVCRGVKSSSKEVLGRASMLCEMENIPFYVINAVDKFNDIVITDFEEQYLKGLTPNPCVICNEYIKFTWFFEKVCEKLLQEKKIFQDEQIFFSTGHYAQIEEKEGNLFIKKAVDKTKDQSYMLYRLPKEILSRCVFPLGTVYKKDIMVEAKEAGYSFESVKESQDICFIEGEYGDFIKQYNPDLKHKFKTGYIFDSQGNRLGKHRGYIYYTIGQRKGLSLGSGPWYVLSVNAETNSIVVGREDEQGQTEFNIEKTNWFIDFDKSKTVECNVMVRYNSSEKPCKVQIDKNNKITVFLEEKTVITPGQSAVFYKDDLVLGGGVICGTDAASCAVAWMPRLSAEQNKDAASRIGFKNKNKSVKQDSGYISLSSAVTGTAKRVPKLCPQVYSRFTKPFGMSQKCAGLQKLSLVNPFSIAEKAEIYYKEITSSTMTDAKKLISQNPPTGTVVLAAFQTDGKGRIEGRKWLSVKGESLTFTIIIKTSDIKFRLSLFPLFAGFCVSGFLEKEFGIKSSIKWPNDVLIEGKKISGILCENSSGYILCGIGLNCREQNMEEIPGKKAVSIYKLTGIMPDLDNILIKFLNFTKNNWENSEWKDIVSEKLYNKGKKVTFYDSLPDKGKAITGIIEGIGENGELIITEDQTGQPKKYYSGEISFN